MLKFYYAAICGDCREAAEVFAARNFTGFELVDITAGTPELREFLALRDTRPEFEEVKREGRIGIPCFLRDDGSLTFDYEEVLK